MVVLFHSLTLDRMYLRVFQNSSLVIDYSKEQIYRRDGVVMKYLLLLLFVFAINLLFVLFQKITLCLSEVELQV